MWHLPSNYILKLSTKCFNIRYRIVFYMIQGCNITWNFHGNHLSQKHIIIQPRSYCITHVFAMTLTTFGSVGPWVCLHHSTCICHIILVIVYAYLTLSFTIQHTLSPMLTLAPLDRASLVPSKFPFLKDSKSKVS